MFYTAPTAIRALIKSGEQSPQKHDLTRLRLLGTVGEPINPGGLDVVSPGDRRQPLPDRRYLVADRDRRHHDRADPGVTPPSPDPARGRCRASSPDIVDEQGEPCRAGPGGYLVIRRPWPSMLRTIWGDNERYMETYWAKFRGCYFTGDGAHRDADGYFWIMGRIDDVLNVSGHRLGTMEIESRAGGAPAGGRSSGGRPARRNQGRGGRRLRDARRAATGRRAELKDELREWVAKEIGAIAKPDDIRFADQLPKTRSGKIMRRLLRELASSGEVKGDITTLEDMGVIARLQQDEE